MTLLGLLAAIQFPILERIPLFGDAAVSPHGLGIAIGFGLGAVLMIQRARKRGLGHLHVPDISEAVQELLTRSAIGAILGARGFYVLTHLSDFEGRWHETLYAWQGGLTFLGGVTGAILLAIPFARKRGWRLDMLLDSAAPGIALGLAVGRIGDLMIGDHIGAPTDFPLAWKCTGNFWVRATNSFGSVDPLPYPSGASPTAGCFDVAVHHTALYDFGATVIVLLVLLAMERKRWFDGAFIAAWVFVYGALRFASDFARQDKTWFGLTGSQWALIGAATAVMLWLLRTKPWQRERWAWDLAFDHPWMSPDYNPDTGQARLEQSSHVALSQAPTGLQPGGFDDAPVEFEETGPDTTAPADPFASASMGTEAAESTTPADAPTSSVTSDEGLWSDRPESVDVAAPASADESDVLDAPDAPADEADAPAAPQASPAWGIGSDTADRVTRSVPPQPKMASRPRKPKGSGS